MPPRKKDKTSEIVREEVFRERGYVGGLCGFKGCLQHQREGTADSLISIESHIQSGLTAVPLYFKALPINFILHHP